MERSINQENHPSFPSNNNTIKEESPRKQHGGGSGGGGGGSGGGGGGGGGGDRLKRDEWSEGAVSSLLEAYEAKWVLRNRAKLKGHDWEDVAKHVSARANSTKSSKTQTQCKNKIESMKKRYRSESATADASSWPLYPRLDLLLRGSAPAPSSTNNPPLVLLEQQSSPPSQPPLPPPPAPPPALMSPQRMPAHQSPIALPTLGNVQCLHESDVQRIAKEDGMETNRVSDHLSDKAPMETDSSTPALYSNKENKKSKRTRVEKKRKRRREEFEVAESIRWLAEVVLRSEEARMETMRELERMRIEAETKRGEMELKRTEIIANTQLEIAKLFAATSGKGVDPSLRIGRS